MRQTNVANHPKRTILFAAILLAFLLGMAELMAFALWKLKVGSFIRNNIKALCGEGFDKPRQLPNTFWHHEFNPDNEYYNGMVNSKGTKGDDFDVPKPEGELRVICIGDSTVEGIELKPNQTFEHFLEERLKPDMARGSRFKSVRVINAGIGSHNSAFTLAYLEFRLIHYQPDVIVIKSSYNDCIPYCVPGMQFDYTNAFPKPFALQRSDNPYWRIARYSFLLKLLGRFLFVDEVANPFKDYSGHITKEQLQTMDFSANEDKFHIYAENIRSMILLCKGRKIKVLVLDLPVSPNASHYGNSEYVGKNFRTLVRRLESELKRVAAEEAVPFIITGPFERNDFWDHCHNTISGNQKIADRIHEVLIKEIN